ncbi:MAG: Tripartite tricarboxylate transporter TctB family [Microvirga sp.]|nr:Tripartite tricarboxylate transporter TctB family [Microvirga sp.]
MRFKVRNRRRLYAGLLIIAIGLAGVYFATSLKFGTAAAMGPGFLPTICSWLVAVLGVMVITQGLHEEVEVIDPPMPRPVFMIFLAIGLFPLLIERAGLGITVFVTAFVASYAGQARFGETLILAVTAAVVTVIVFVVLLGLPIPVWPEIA